MRAGGVPIAALLLVLGFTISQVSAVGDIYLEGEEDLANEFLEVKENDATIFDHLKRIKRNFDWGRLFSSSNDDSDDAITTESPGDGAGYGKDDDLDNFGSGSVDKADTEVKEKTLQVTFTVVEPYLPAYFNRDSPEFIDLSRSLANAVDQLFENLPGTQRSTLVRIQSSLTEEFSCKVTLDIVTSGYDNTDHIKDVLKHYITTYNRLGKTTVNDNDFSVKVIPANYAEGPSPDYPEPVDPNTFDPNIYNQNNEDHITDDNQYKPNIDDQDQTNYAPTPEINQNPDQNIEYTFPTNNFSPNSDNQNNYGTPDDRDNQIDSDSTRGDGGRIGESDDIPSVSSEGNPKSNDNQSPYETTTQNTEGYDGLNIDNTSSTEPSVQDCPMDHIRCDKTRCVEKSLRCDGTRDCDDGLDEADCPDSSCGIDDFRCENGHCIESSRRCDGVDDCLNQEDERGCNCRPDEFRCNSDGACIEERKRCDGIPQCSDGSDESDCLPWTGDYACHDTGKFRCADGHCISMLLRCDGFKDCRNGGNDEIGCPCRSDQWQCDHGSCIKRKYRCDGRVDCPTDRSDERNCLANRFFTCRNGQIIPEYLRCNRQYDCPPGDLSDEQNCPCGASDFKCDNGHCIPATKHCDRTHDCQDGSDERHCTYGTVCMAYEYECKSGMCVQAEARCNGTAECNDETDEIGCPCKRGQYPCRDGTCINIAYLCNGHKDCSNGEDEYNCKSTCPPDQFTCLGGPTLCAEKCNNIPECEGGEDEEHCPACAHQCDGKCIPAAQVCDNQEDCSDGSDEQHCQYCNKPGDFRCGSGECLPFALKCNDIPECVDSSDEKYCNQSMATDNAQCSAEEFQCLSDLVCIDARFYCDNQKDCLDGSDETNCPCPADSWQCRDGQCIPTLDYCDGKVDCTDGTDESECNWTTQRTYVVPSTGMPVTSSNVYTQRPGYDDGSGNRNPANRYPDNNGGNNNGQNGDRWNIPGGGYPGAPGRGSDGSQDGDTWNPNGGYPDDNSPGAPGRGSGGSQDGDRWNDPNSGYPDGSSPGAPDRGSGGQGGRGSGGACSSNQWRCENGPCIDAVRRCDGHIDCPFDYSDEFDCPPNSSLTLNLKTYPENQTVRYGGDVVFQCRDEGPQRANVIWRMIGKPIKEGSSSVRGRLEMYDVTSEDSGIYICEAEDFIGYPGSQVRVTLHVENSPITYRPPFPTCQPFEATCANGQCIPKAGVCDGRIDCSDKSDEDNCHHEGMCEPNQFKCNNRKCVLKTWICDSEDDCGDGSDEENCGTREAGKCAPAEFTCASKNQCIPRSFHCDGQSDCIDRSDEIGCLGVHVTISPKPSNVRLNPGDTLILRSEAVGLPTPIISWRLNWGHVPAKCSYTNDNGVGILTCPNMQPEDSGAYSSEAINNKGAAFAPADAIVIVNNTNLCPRGYFNSEARTSSECIPCFCFGKSTQCRSADLFTYNMPMLLGEGGTRLIGIKVSPSGDVNIDSQPITNQYYYQPLRNGATVTKFGDVSAWSNSHPYVTLPESYNGNQLKSYGGHIKYTLSPQTQIYGFDDSAPTIIIKGKYGNLFHMNRAGGTGDINIEARITPEGWSKKQDGSVPATRADIMMVLDDIQMILLRADLNNAGVNITDFVMESADHLNVGLGAASLVEECTCPAGYEGLSCQKCSVGYKRSQVGPWLGSCRLEECPAGTYGDPASGLACKPCPCPLTNRENQFARTCSLGPSGSVICDCLQGYEGNSCEVCAPGYEGNPLIPGNSCQPKKTDNCDPVGTKSIRPPDECVCKVNVQGRYCNQCKDDSFFLSSDFRQGCATCFCTGVTQQCKSSNFRRKTISVQFNVPQIVDEIKIFNSAPASLGGGTVRYSAPKETTLVPELTYGEINVNTVERSSSNIYYWSMPRSFAGDKVTSYGGYLRYVLKNVPSMDPRYRNTAAHVQIISDNRLTFHYKGNFSASHDGLLNASIQLLEDNWRRSDGGEISRPDFLLALADVRTILIKATYGPNSQLATPVSASIDIADRDGNGPIASHVEECDCLPGYIGTSCEDCAAGYTRNGTGIYLESCGLCDCNKKSEMCDPENGVCFNCGGNSEGDHCERCKPGYIQDPYGNCIEAYSSTSGPCRCDPRGTTGPCDAAGNCRCKQNVIGDSCNTCRPGTFGLESDNTDGCLPCYCSGVTSNCHEGGHYTRVPIGAPVLGDNYGGFSITDLNAQLVIKDHFVPLFEQSELMYTFQFQPDVELYWSLPVLPGNRVLSYGGSISLRQKFSSENDMWSERGNDVILDGGDIRIVWSNPNQFQSGQSYSYQVPLKEGAWLILNTVTPATRNDFMTILRNLKRVLVRATVAPSIYETTIADVSMDTATQSYDVNLPVAKGIEICMCPEGYSGTSCETCKSGYYQDDRGFCRKCSCNGQDCQLDVYGRVICLCQPPYTGSDCSTIGLVMELHPTIHEANDDDSLSRRVTFTCKYRAPEPLTIKFYHQGHEQRPPKYFNESRLEKDGWHGKHVWHTVWDTRRQGELYECHTITERGFTLGVLTTSLPEPGGDASVFETTTPSVIPDSTISVTIISPSIKIQEIGSSVNFTCQAQSRVTRNRLPVNWVKRDGELPLDRAYIDGRNGYLVITNLQVTDSGVYICETSDGISTAQASATLRVPGNQMTPPSVEIFPSVKDYYEGDPIELECRVKGNPTPAIKWQRNKPLPLSAENRGSFLIIESARVEDSGEYRCIASNNVGSDDRTTVITIRPRPSWPQRDTLTISNTAPTVTEGQSIRIVCTGSTNVPAGSIDWIRQDSAIFLPNVRSENGVLYIDAAESANQGVYICRSPQANVAPIPVLLSVVTLNPEPEIYNITVSVARLKIPTGGSGTVDCNPVGSPLPLVKWTKHEGALGSDLRQRDNSLIINNARQSDEGYYVCEATVNGEPVASAYVFVEIERREMPVVKIWPEGEQAVILGAQFELHCRVLGGIPEPYVTWNRNGGRPLSPTTEIQPQNVLRFNNVDVNDEGEYTCEARNDAGSASASSVIKVRSPPEITITPSDYVTVPRGDQVNVDCRANGYPQPMVSISFRNRQIVPPQPGHATLRIPSASPSDSGDYSCTAESVAGSITNQFLIDVDRGDGGYDVYTGPSEGSGESEIPEPYDPIINVPSDQFVIEGKPETVIYCNGSGSVRWSRADNMPLQRNVYQADSRLVILNASKSDSGEYVCSIYENNEVIQEVHISLVVVTEPKITLRPQKQTVQPGQSPSVECVVSGDDIIEVTWTRRDRPPSSRMQVRSNVLQFRQIEVEDAGQYECFARSRYANISGIAEVNVIEDSGRSMVSHDREQWAAAGSAVRLACNATRPNTQVVWTKDGRPLPRSVIQRRDGSLYIRFAQKSDSGRYVCNIQNQNGRILSSKYIILHIQGYECLKTEFRCYDSSGCIDERLLCDGRRNCRDNSDEENCLGRDKRFSDKLEDPLIFDGASGEPVQLVTIEQPHTMFRVGDNVNVLCKIRSRDVNSQWLRLGTNQYIPSVTYGDGAMLTINGVTAADAGVYRCVGLDRAGRNSFDDFVLKVDVGSPSYPDPGDSMHVAEYTARLREQVYLPCRHDLELPVTIEWTKEYSTLPSDMRTNQPNLYFESVTEADAGTYICRVSNNRGSAQAMAILTVKGVVPRFDGKSYISLPTIKDAFREFDIEISFKPSDENGLILYNSQNQGREGDYIALQLTNGVPEFIMNTRTAQIKQVKADRPLQLNTWHTIRLRRTDSKVTMDVDNRGPFIEESQEHWQVLDLKQPLYIGGVPDYDQLPAELADATGFIGCVGMLILGREEKNIMIDSIEQIGTSDCESCIPNLCLNNGFCQEARNERGYMCICATGYAGLNCDRTGEACRPGLCGPGKCSDTDTGYKCACPVTHTGKKCETAQSIEYPAFTGSAYLAIKPPGSSRTLQMSMNIKAATPVTDGIIMYCAESSRGYGGFTSLAVHDGRLEFRYDLGKGSKPVVLVSNRTLPANEWTNVRIARIGSVVLLKINSVYSYEERLVPPTNQWNLPLDTPIFVGGVDDSITLNNNTGVSGGFNGCIKDFTMHGQAVDIVNQTIQSANVQECVSSVDDRGDIPEGENIVCQCRNGGQCLSGEATVCSCPYGFTGPLCEYRAPPSMRDGRQTDPCAARPCRNGGSCRPNRSTRMNYSCDCLLGFAGDNCQIHLELYQSVAFNGDGYMELPASLINYSQLDIEPAVIALAIHTTNDGVLMYQKEAQSPPDYGDYILLRIDRGIVVIEWDLGGGKSSVSVGEVFVNDGERHQIIAKLLMDGQVSLSVDSITNTGTTAGFSNIMNADSNIYLGGIPDSINQHAYPGFIGCIEQFELMDSHRGLNLGQLAVAGRNTQRCKDQNAYRDF